MKILYVEDEQDIREPVVDFIQSLGHQCDSAKDGIEALEIYDNHDIVITDWLMPDMNGLELLKKLRTRQEYVYIIFATALNDDNSMVQSLTYGANDYMTKPFSLEELEYHIEQAKYFLALSDSLDTDLGHLVD